MKKNGMKVPASTLALFIAAAVLLLYTTIGGARAALTIFSDDYNTRLEMRHVGITLNENGTPVDERDYDEDGHWTDAYDGVLLKNMLAEGERLQFGKTYDEVLTVTNTSNTEGPGINEFVRVKVRKYWVDSNGKKTTELSPEHIELTFSEGDWVIDHKEDTDELTVLYYTKLLNIGETTTPFMTGISVSEDIPYTVTETVEKNGRYTTITRVFKYDGYSLVLEAEADGIQEHHAADAILSAWGREVNISGNTLSLK